MDLQQGQPRISIIVAAYNHATYVEEALRGVMAQDYAPLELIIMNDGSTDGTDEVIRRLLPECEERFVRALYQPSANEGLNKTLNKAIALAQGDYVFLTAADDRLTDAAAIRHMYNALSAEPTAAMVHADLRFIDESGTPFCQGEGGNWLGGRSYDTVCPKGYHATFFAAKGDGLYPQQLPSFGRYDMLLQRYRGSPISLCRRAVLEECGLFDESRRVAEDLAMALKVSKQHRILFLDRVAGDYRIHGNNTSIRRRADMWRDVLEVIEREKPYCAKQGLLHVWRRAFARAFLFVLWLDGWRYLVQKYSIFRILCYTVCSAWLEHSMILKIMFRRVGRKSRA